MGFSSIDPLMKDWVPHGGPICRAERSLLDPIEHGGDVMMYVEARVASVAQALSVALVCSDHCWHCRMRHFSKHYEKARLVKVCSLCISRCGRCLIWCTDSNRLWDGLVSRDQTDDKLDKQMPTL